MKDFLTVAGIFIAVIAFAFTAIYFDEKDRNQPELSKNNWGVVKDVRMSTTGGILGSENTLIITDKASLSVYGSHAISIGDTLWMRHSKSHDFIISKFGNRILVQ